MPEALLTDIEVAKILRLNRRTVCNWRYTGLGPPWIKLSSGSVRYALSDIQAYLAGLPRVQPKPRVRKPTNKQPSQAKGRVPRTVEHYDQPNEDPKR